MIFRKVLKCITVFIFIMGPFFIFRALSDFLADNIGHKHHFLFVFITALLGGITWTAVIINAAWLDEPQRSYLAVLEEKGGYALKWALFATVFGLLTYFAN